MIRAFLLTALTLLAVTQAKADEVEKATEAVKNMGVGWNLGNTLDSHNGTAQPDIAKSETMWGQPVTKPELMQMMKRAGFGAIRVPVTWYPHIDAEGKVDAAWMKRVREVVDYVTGQGLYCIINVHHDTGADSSDGIPWLKADMDVYRRVRERYEMLWRQIATEFRDYDQRLLFESYNEMLDTYSSWCFASYASPDRYDATLAASAYDAINSYAQSFVDAVRGTGGNNAQRNLIINTYGACSGAGHWNPHLQDPLKQMKLPEDKAEGHLIFQIHTYPNISNMNSAKSEVNQMMADLKTHLVAKGAPVIIGEWGTSSTNEDYLNRRPQLLEFARYMIEATKDNGMGTLLWMGLTDGAMRSIPAFNQPDLAEAILKAYHGEGFEGVFPTIDDFDLAYTVNYDGAWQEMHLYAEPLKVSNFQGIRLELTETPPAGTLQAKFYGSNTSGTQLLSAASTLIKLPTAYGATLQRVTLQYCKSTSYSVGIRRIALVRKDGTEEQVMPSVFWGCTLSVDVQPKLTGIRQTSIDKPTESESERIYTLTGQRLNALPRQGLYISNRRKLMVR